jgi:hypothetical protein
MNVTTRSIPNPFLRLFAATLLASLFTASCATAFKDIEPPAKGSVLNPVKCDMPEGERRYLKRLLTTDNRPVEYEYYDSVIGADGKILDRFMLKNPLHGIEDSSGASKGPGSFRIYMDLYHRDTVDTEPIPGFKFYEGE